MTQAAMLTIAIGLAMDAFATAVCKGLAVKKLQLRHTLKVGLWFGAFQALMPLMGWVLGRSFERYIQAIDHWVAFGLLGWIGMTMIHEAISEEKRPGSDALHAAAMLPLALATSIDALTVGVTFALLPNVAIGPAVSLIGGTTFLLSALGMALGHRFGTHLGTKAELAGGGLLILMGLKILLDHLA